MNLSLKLVLPTVLMSVVSLAAVATISYTSATRLVTNTFESEMDTVLKNTSSQFEFSEEVTASVMENFDEKNLALCRSLAEMLDKYKDRITDKPADTVFWQDIADKIGATEICIIDEKGIIVSGNIAAYNGFDMGSGEQSAVFLDIVDDPTLEIAQEPMANASYGTMMQYFGVTRIDAPGLVQVGLTAEISSDLASMFDIQKITSAETFGKEGYVTVIKDDVYVANPDESLIGEPVEDKYLNLETDKMHNIAGFEVKTAETADGSTILAIIPEGELQDGINKMLLNIVIVAIITALITGIVIVILTHKLAVSPLNRLMKSISGLTDGDLHSKPQGNFSGEFLELSTSIQTFSDTVSGYIAEISDVLSSLAANNYDVDVYSDYKGDFAPLKTGLHTIITEINSVMHEIKAAANAVGESGEGLLSGSNTLADFTGSQSIQANEIAQGLTVIQEGTTEAEKYAGEAKTLSDSAAELMNVSNDFIRKLTISMESIKSSSENIMKVTNTVDSIAFQTNILALNASVEAARAGANGKGFAVVAQEVRNLATKSTDAVKETAMLVDQSTSEIMSGAGIVAAAEESFTQAMQVVQEINGKIAELSRIAELQNTQVTDIAPRVHNVAVNVKQTADEADRSAERSRNLAQLADRLQKIVNNFKLQNN
jgi:methyl-accepting chemotaxis protein